MSILKMTSEYLKEKTRKTEYFKESKTQFNFFKKVY